MAKGNGILVSTDNRGRIMEGKVDGALLPGTVVQIKASTEPVSGLAFTWEAYNRAADGDRPQGPIGVLLEDYAQGKTADDAYVSGDRCRVYIPLPGDELNMLVSKAGTGTGDSIAIGDIFIVNDGDGLLVATTGSVESEPFMAMETVSDVEAEGTLVWCIFSGH